MVLQAASVGGHEKVAQLLRELATWLIRVETIKSSPALWPDAQLAVGGSTSAATIIPSSGQSVSSPVIISIITYIFSYYPFPSLVGNICGSPP